MQLRDANIERLADTVFDVLIIGGGINGAVSAAALAGKGAKVALIDERDFAGFTSMHSSNLAWGGIKYMETYEFQLVRQLCKSRNHLLKHYPSTVQEIRFFTTIRKGFRWHPLLLWLGTWLYWLIGNCYTRPPRLLSKRKIQTEEPVVDTTHVTGGFVYSDAYLYDNDARFVFNFIRTAMDRGCVAANYVRAETARQTDQDGGIWTVQARDLCGERHFEIKARVLINAGGAFADRLNQTLQQQTEHHHVFSKGIHLIVDRVTPNRQVLAFFADDGRLFFAIPMGARTCIGTTDTRVEDPHTEVTEEDRKFVLDNINKCLQLDKPLSKEDIIAERCGVRPLVIKADGGGNRDFLQLSRKHEIDVNRATRLITIFGGKLTDCINVGDEICEYVQQMDITLPAPREKWYGEPSADIRAAFFRQAERIGLDRLTPPSSTEPLSTRYWRRYGAEAITLLKQIQADPRQAELLIQGTEYTRCELQLAAQREMITKLEDFLRRRSKIALVVRKADIKHSQGLMEACEILFGDQAQQKFDEYFADSGSVEDGIDRADMSHSKALNW
ncbi:MAG: FAD-dependent oxidoreductase [Candidatus Competibacteraceae bacterium]|nr:FAD-dependent oxidoreductase [Candidatus Competibacteraceae bacterium]